MILYPLFYRRFGVRIAQQLMTPVVSSIDKFEFPRNSVYHFVSFDGVHTGPETTDYLFRHEVKPIAMHHITEMVVDKGAPRKLSLPILNSIRTYHAKNKRFRIVIDDDNKPKDETTLYVYNYGFIPQTYRYMRSVFTEYYKWWNIEKTLWSNVNKCAQSSNRQQFIFMSLPKILPSIATLNMYSKVLNTQFIKIFNSRESLMVLELWKWLSDDFHSESVMGGLEKTSLDKINIVVQDGTNWSVINLGTLDSWKKVEDSDSPQKMVIPAEQLQKRFLRFMMSMTERRAVEEQISVDTDEQDQTQAQTATDTIAQVGNLEENLDPESLSGLDLSDKILLDLDADLKKLEDIEKVAYVDEDDKKISNKAINPQELFKDITVEQQLLNEINIMAEDGILNASEYKRLVSSSESFKNMPSPYDKTKTISEDSVITKEKILVNQAFEIPDIKSVPDKSMLKTTLIDFDERYIRDIMPKDNLNMVSNIQKAGIIINSYDVEKVNDVLGNYEFHTLKIKPLQGMPSTLRFKVPSVDDEGNFTVNGNKYKMRKQRGDLPIRKTSPSTVSLQSYYSKCFVQRSSKKVNNYPVWLTSQIMSKGLDVTDNTVTELKPGDVFNNTFKCPRTYSILGQSFRGFKSGKNNFLFDRSEIEKHFSPEEIKKYEANKNKMTLVGFTDTNAVLLMDKNDAIYEANDADLQVKGTIESMLGISEQFAPVEFSEMKMMGKFLPVGVVLAYDIGFDNLLSLLKVTPRRLSTGERVNLQPHEWSIVFSDETLVFSKDDKLATMVLAGFNEYHRFIRNYSVYTFDKKNVYLNILENSGLNARYLKEINLLDKLFVDPITKELLTEMKEPETFKGLLLRSSELLLNDQHPDLMDMNYMRIKGYERFSGAIYNELSQAIRSHSNKGGKANSKVELNPYAIWTRITTDPSVGLLDEINPIENLKQVEAVTFSGVGGRMKRAMTKPTRDYHPNDMGVISEATKDSSDVSINTYLSANPQFNSLRGTTNRFNYKEQGATSLVSTSALISVGSDKDDAKRVNFISIQMGHGIACTGYTQPMVRTGYEQVLAQRTTSMFAYTAKQDGTVISKTDDGVIIEYEDKSKKGIEIGRRFSSSAGLTYPQDIVCELAVGQAFKKGDVISYNSGFFESDYFNPKNIVWRSGIVAKTVLWESNQTHEDASSISKRLAEKLTSRTAKIKTIVVKFDQEVKGLVKIGQEVDPESVLCTIEDAITSNSNLFDEESLNTLKMLSNQTPTAKVRGTVDKIEVFYHGEKEDMSNSLLQISNQSDRGMLKRTKSFGDTGFDGSVNDDYRVDGEPLMPDTLAIKIYITSDVPAGSGDKGVFANQMKTVFSEVLENNLITESGETIDAVFGQKSIEARIVLSPSIIGTTNTLLKVIAKKAVQIFKED